MSLLTAGELSRRSGVSVSAIHFYERKGLIHSGRTAGNQRRYERGALRLVAIIKIAKGAGIPLAEVASALAGLPRKGAASRRDWERISKLWAKDLDSRIDGLVKLRGSLGDCIGCGCLSLERCNLLNPGDALASEGPGPVRLNSAASLPSGRPATSRREPPRGRLR